MSDVPSNTNDNALSAPDTSGSNVELPSYDIAPEDQALADEITSKDMVWDTKGPTQVVGAVKFPASIKATGLPPHLRDPIMAQLANVPVDRREAEEQRLVNDALYQNARDVRVVCGPGDGAGPYWREKFNVAFEISELERRILQLGNELAEVERWDNVDGTPVPVFRVNGDRRAGLDAEHRRLLHNLNLLDGIEGERRLAKALHEDVAQTKALREQLAIQREGEELAAKTVREERVKAIAEAHAKRRRNAL